MNFDTKALVRLTTYLLKADPDMTVSRFHIFLHIARSKNVLVRDLVRATGYNQSTISRSLALLGKKPQRGEKNGLHWIDVGPDPDDPRRVVANLSPKGRQALSEIEQMIN